MPFVRFAVVHHMSIPLGSSPEWFLGDTSGARERSSTRLEDPLCQRRWELARVTVGAKIINYLRVV